MAGDLFHLAGCRYWPVSPSVIYIEFFAGTALIYENLRNGTICWVP
jgi:hypothetical protein